jgi:hypothetical protein
VLGFRCRNFRGNKVLVCQPEMPQLGGPPKRSEGGEGHRMVGPLYKNEEKNIVKTALVEVTSFHTFPSKSRTFSLLSQVTK